LRIVVDRFGTMFGNRFVGYVSTLHPTVGANLTVVVDKVAGIRSWRVLNEDLIYVQVSTAEGRVSSITLTEEGTPLDLIRCVPVGEVSVAGKYPGAMALIRLLAQSIRDPVIQCAAPITVPGFVEGANTVAIEQSGALRINGPGGPSLHLPSTNFSIGASLAMTADGVVLNRGMGYNFGSAQVSVSVDGRITDLLLHGMRCRVPG
jgi:hypothetical protein